MKRRVLITGGGSGIGLAIARTLAAGGLDVTVSGRSQASLEATGLPWVTLDVTDEASLKHAESASPFDIVVANAGDAKTAPLLKTPRALWDSMLAVNLTGVFSCAQAFVPAMVENGWGRFIVIASTSSLRGYPYTGAYSAAKHGVLGMVKTLALELAKTGVTANAVCPGFTETGLLSRSIENVVKSTGMSPHEAKSALVKGNPMGRAVQPAEVAAAVQWLASEAAGATNGQSIVIDGGELAG